MTGEHRRAGILSSLDNVRLYQFDQTTNEIADDRFNFLREHCGASLLNF